MNFETVKTMYEGKKPNLGKMQLNLLAKDDAKHVLAVPVLWIAYAVKAMPFLHVWFALDYYKNHVFNAEYASLFELVFELSRIRNHRVMRDVNKAVEQYPDVIPFTVPEDTDAERIIAAAKKKGINVDAYFNTESDADDVRECSNEWCRKQNPECGKASDNVQIITDLDGVDWFVLIVRQNGPGRKELAWAGGFVDKGESFKAAAAREKDEETEVSITGLETQCLRYTTTETVLTPVMMNDWDARIKFAKGMQVGATVTHTKFTQ